MRTLYIVKHKKNFYLQTNKEKNQLKSMKEKARRVFFIFCVQAPALSVLWAGWATDRPVVKRAGKRTRKNINKKNLLSYFSVQIVCTAKIYQQQTDHHP